MKACTLAIAFALALARASIAQPQPQQPDGTIDAATRTEVIETALRKLHESYVFPEKAKDMEKAIRERMARREYDDITSATTFARTLTTHLQDVTRDKHLRVNYSYKPLPTPPAERRRETPEERERRRQMGGFRNYGFHKLERLAGNVGYLDLDGFLDTEFGGETAAAAMTWLANSSALIVDLRHNGGGSPAMVVLISSYLFDADPVHLNSLYWRQGDRTHQWWTLPYVPGGRRLADKDIYVLTSRRTFSAAEEFTYNLQNRKRATIVGETTGGGAHPGGFQRLHDHFGMFVPSGRAINPISGTNWEGTGVKPDIEVPQELAFAAAHLKAIERLLEKTTEEPLKEDLQRARDAAQKELDKLKSEAAPKQPTSASAPR